MNIAALLLIFFGVFLLFILFFIESGSSNSLSGNLSGNTVDDSTLSGGNPCILFTEIFLTIIVIALLITGFIWLYKPEKKNVQSNQSVQSVQENQVSNGNYLTQDNVNSVINSGKKLGNNYQNINTSYNSLRNLKNVSELGKYASSAEATEGIGALFSTAETLAPLLAFA